jgi:hypothetical protein
MNILNIFYLWISRWYFKRRGCELKGVRLIVREPDGKYTEIRLQII